MLVNKIYACLAVVFLALAIIGIFLPVVPTTPFVIAAAWAASKGSPRIHAWLHNHVHMGPILRAWNERGAVPRKAKWLACCMMTLSWFIMFFIGLVWWWLAIMAVIFVSVSIYLFSRPDA